MTATEIFDHPEYLNRGYSFPDECWTRIKKNGFSNYRQSNYFRIKNIITGNMIKSHTSNHGQVFYVNLKNDKNKIKKLKMKELFDDFDVETCSGSEFIYGAF